MPSSRFPAPAPRRGKNADSAPEPATPSASADRSGGTASPKNQKPRTANDRQDRRGDNRQDRKGGRPAAPDRSAPRQEKETGGREPSRPGSRPDTRKPPRRETYGARPAKKRGGEHTPPSSPKPFADDARDFRLPGEAAANDDALRELAPTGTGEADSFLQPGIKPVTELLQQTPEKVDTVFLRKGRKDKDTSLILDLCRENGVRFSLVDDAGLDRVWHGRHQGVIARLFSTGFTDLSGLLALAPGEPLPLIVALDQVQDPGNAGALARTLYALGGAGLLVPRHNGVFLGAAAARIAAGALEKLPVAKVANLAQALDDALDAGYTVYGADAVPAETGARSGIPAESVFAFTPRLPAVLVLGGEDGGIRPIIRKRCSAILSIPFAREFDSLNVAQAGAIIISAFAAAMRR